MHRKRVAFLLSWTTLAGAGWLAYVLIRALAAVIYLGAPVYDWQWYTPISVLLVGGPIHFVWRRSHSPSPPTHKAVLGVFIALLVWAVAGFNGFGHIEQLNLEHTAPPAISFWGNLDFRQLPDSFLRDLQSAGGRLYYGVSDQDLSGERAQALVGSLRRLDEYGIEAYLAPPSGNDFLSVPVYRDWISSTQATAAFVAREGLTNVRGFIGDAEQPAHSPLDLTGADRSGFWQAVSGLRDVIDVIHREHPDLHVGLTANWSQYVDQVDGDPDLSMVMRSPVEPPGGWDFVNLMTYSSYFPAEWRPYYVYLLERAMARLYPPEQTSYLIGLFGSGMEGEPLLDFDDLVRDARLSQALGVRDVGVFNLNGALQTYGDGIVGRMVDAMRRPTEGKKIAVPFSRPVSLLFYGVVAADAFLDIRGPRAWLWVMWIVLSGVMVRKWRR